MRVVTAGRNYLDIDAYGGIIAYTELLQTQGQQAIAASSSVLNESITRTIRSWSAPLATNYQPQPADTFTLIDVSNPDYFDPIVNLEQIDEVIDHHLGFEDYWRPLIGQAADIEFVGAACTQVYERWHKAGLQTQMSPVSARLLISGILDNTLNFKAKVTTERDHRAYSQLCQHANVPATYSADYFSECQKSIVADPATGIANDAKLLRFKTYPEQLGVGQLVVWDAADILKHHLPTVEQVMATVNPHWLMNLVSVEEGSSYFIAKDPAIRHWASNLLDLEFNNTIAKARRLWLRKEIIKRDLESTQNSAS